LDFFHDGRLTGWKPEQKNRLLSAGAPVQPGFLPAGRIFGSSSKKSRPEASQASGGFLFSPAGIYRASL
jgi:hypothetical protein